MNYPNDSLQDNIDGVWWEEDKSAEPKRGSLLWVYCSAIEPKPSILIPSNRSTPTNHNTAQVIIKTVNSFEDIKNQSKLPIAGLPIWDKEFYFVFRSKMRPALVLSEPTKKLEGIPKENSKHITQRTLLVAPYYGTKKNNTTARVERKCAADPSLAVAHGCFWRLHPALAYEWELRLQHELSDPTFTLDELDAGVHRARFLTDQPDLVREVEEREAKRRERAGGGEEVDAVDAVEDE